MNWERKREKDRVNCIHLRYKNIVMWYFLVTGLIWYYRGTVSSAYRMPRKEIFSPFSTRLNLRKQPPHRHWPIMTERVQGGEICAGTDSKATPGYYSLVRAVSTRLVAHRMYSRGASLLNKMVTQNIVRTYVAASSSDTIFDYLFRYYTLE